MRGSLRRLLAGPLRAVHFAPTPTRTRTPRASGPSPARAPHAREASARAPQQARAWAGARAPPPAPTRRTHAVCRVGARARPRLFSALMHFDVRMDVRHHIALRFRNGSRRALCSSAATREWHCQMLGGVPCPPSPRPPAPHPHPVPRAPRARRGRLRSGGGARQQGCHASAWSSRRAAARAAARAGPILRAARCAWALRCVARPGARCASSLPYPIPPRPAHLHKHARTHSVETPPRTHIRRPCAPTLTAGAIFCASC